MEVGSFLDKHAKIVIILLILIIIGCIGGMLVLGITNFTDRKTYITVMAAPTSATVTLDGVEYKTGMHEIEPGDYSVKIVADDFIDKEFTLRVDRGNVTSISTYLVHVAEGMEYYLHDRDSFEILRRLSVGDDERLQNFMDSYDKLVSVEDVLPLWSSFIGTNGEIITQTIRDSTYDERCQMIFCLIVSGDETNQEAAERTLKEKGYTLSDYEVIYGDQKETE